MLELALLDRSEVDHDALLAGLRRTFPLRSQLINGVEWTYIDSSVGAQTVVLLPGALGVAETSFHYILAFAPRYRVISLDYPPTITQVEPLLTGLTTLLAAEKAGAVHLVGGSYSGPIAHAFAQRYPAQVRSLIFANSGLPQQWRALQFGALLGLLLSTPPALIHLIMYGAMGNFLSTATAVERFWQRYFRALLPTLPRAFFTGRVRLFLKLIRQPRTTDWRGPTLIGDAVDDTLFNPAERTALRAAYPQARQHDFAVHGHGSALTAYREHVAIYTKFWESLDCHG